MHINLAKNTGIYFLTNLLSQGAVFIFWIIAANVLPPSQIGVYALVIFIVNFFGAFAIFGLDSAITRFYHSEEKIEEIFSNALIIFSIAVIFSIAILYGFSGIISKVIPNIESFLGKDILLFYALIITVSLYNLALVHYSALRDAVSYAKVSIVQTVLFFVLAITFLFINFDILGVLYALLFSYLASGIVFLLKEFKLSYFKNFGSRKILKLLLNYGTPMMLTATLGIIATYIGSLLLNKYTTLSTLGIYSFFLTIAMQVNALWATFNRAWTPSIFSSLKEDKDFALKQVETMAFFSSFLYLLLFVVFVIFVNLGGLTLLLKPDYLSNIGIFYILLIGTVFNGVYTSAYPLYYYQKKTHVILFLSIALNIINIILTFLLVKPFGQIGAATSYFLFSFISVFAYLYVFKKIAQIPVEIIKWAILLFCITSTAVLFYLLTSSAMLLVAIVCLGILFSYKKGKVKENIVPVLNLIKYKFVSLK